EALAYLRPLRAKALKVPCLASTFPAAVQGKRALVWLDLDFWADTLRLWGYQRSEATAAPHSRVGELPRMLPAGAAPHLPSTPGTRHTRECNLLDPDRRPETPNRGRAGPRCHRGSHASVATAAWAHIGRSHDRTAIAWCCAWELRSGCRP